MYDFTDVNSYKSNVQNDHSLYLTGDINIPPYSELDNAFNNIKNIIDRYGRNSLFISKINNFDTFGLDLNGLESDIPLMFSVMNGLVSESSSLYRIYNDLKGVEEILHQFDSKDGLYDMALNNYEFDITTILSAVLDNYNKDIKSNYLKLKRFESKNGGWFIQKDNCFTIGIPDNYHGQPMNLLIFFTDYPEGYSPTLGEDNYVSNNNLSLNFQENIIDKVMEQNPNTIVAVSYAWIGSKYVDDMLAVLNDIGVDSDKTVVSGFSDGGNYAVETTAKLIKDYRENSQNEKLKNLELVLFECNHTKLVGQEALQQVKDEGIKCTLMHSLTDQQLKDNYNHLINKDNKGVDFWVINFSKEWQPSDGSSSHLEKKRMAIQDNYFGYFLGNSELPPNDYTYLHYNSSEDSFVEVLQ